MRCLIVLVLLAPCAAGAYSISLVNEASGNIVRWHQANIPYRLHSAGSADIVDGSDLDAVRQAFNQWNAVSCSKLNFTEEGVATFNTKVSLVVGGDTNGKNDITWAEGSEWVFGAYVLGITQTSFTVPSGEITEADIAFNGYQNKWSTTGKANTVDVLNVAAHETGHFFGAQHALGGFSASDPPTMAPTADPYLKSQSLNDDDMRCACFLNPQTEYNCQTDADCPLIVGNNQFGEEVYVGKLTCKSSLCGGVSAQVPEGTKVLGEACASDFDCKKPLFCQPTGSGSSCAKDCNTDADCGAGFKCFPYSNGSGGVCLPWTDPGGGPNPPAPSKDNGEACNSPDECKSGLCVGAFGTSSYYCRASCKVGSNDCASGESCDKLQGSSYGACIPGGPGSQGTKSPGQACESAFECLSGLCVGGGPGGYFCREGCSPAVGDCPENQECFQLAGGSGGACLPVDPKKELGETCKYSNDCTTDFCLNVIGGDGAFCSKACKVKGDCPCGMTCQTFQGGDQYCKFGGPKACTPSGNYCETADVCISQTCVGSVCRDPCTLGKSACPPGQGCQRIKATSVTGYCDAAGELPAGDDVPCNVDADCMSRLCLLEGGKRRCALPCDPASTVCGLGRACLQHEGTALFVCGPAPAVAEDPPIGGDNGGGDADAGGAGDANGSGSPGAEVDVDQEEEPTRATSACQVGAPSAAGPWLVLLVLVALRARRRAAIVAL